ncbi:uncharacterized protein EI97DRAFT_432999 [Westerdykella ornata]|uniref:TPR domain-containing protein n=1 Tax=Westerdykella ornata TaxID=318751 RepID=A0A6A6JKX7_WESOR|nr:uncharacterized protein EI97DRAFT_432999 [Westerdykella ornata]KAF2276763.1 hypothetical protein EI97DRAFT_432999 [Westerdykella ornata]
MFSRALPRAVPRAGRFAQCEARPQALSKLPQRTWAPLQQQSGRRQRSSFVAGMKENYNRNPILFPFAMGCILLLTGFAVTYLPWYYQNVIIAPYHNFPEPVAKKLRRAIYYSKGKNIDLREANKYFRQALQIANEMGIDPFSPEILGVKYAISQLFEQAGHYPLACDVLEIMRVDCQRWMDEYSDRHWTDGDRSRVLKVIVQLNVKLGELYTSKYMNQPEDAEKRLVDAVEIALKERARREKDGVKEGEGEFLTDEELGGALESLGHHYERNDKHYLATPLFLQALSYCPQKSCHSVVLMNNISTCLAQQTPPPPSTSPPTKSSFPTTKPPSRAELVDQARQWANKAIEHAATIAPPERTEECDVGCAVATHNLGEFFEMEGRWKEARLKYEEADSVAKVVGFEEGRERAKEGIRRLEGKEREGKK